MSISRRGALLGATAAVVSGATTAPLAFKVAGVKASLAGELNDEPLLALRRRWLAWRDLPRTWLELRFLAIKRR